MFSLTLMMSNLDTIFKVPLSGGGSYPSVVVFTGTKHRVQSPLERWLSMISMNRPKMESRPYEFLLHYLCAMESSVCSHAQSCLTLCNPMDLQLARLLCPWNSPGKNTGLGCHFPLQGNLPDPRIKPASLAFPALAGRFFTTAPPADHGIQKKVQNSLSSVSYIFRIS